MDGDTNDISIEGGKAEQKTQHQQNIEKHNVPRSTLQDCIIHVVIWDTYIL